MMQIGVLLALLAVQSVVESVAYRIYHYVCLSNHDIPVEILLSHILPFALYRVFLTIIPSLILGVLMINASKKLAMSPHLKISLINLIVSGGIVRYIIWLEFHGSEMKLLYNTLASAVIVGMLILILKPKIIQRIV